MNNNNNNNNNNSSKPFSFPTVEVFQLARNTDITKKKEK
jgi:hypothetical protein